MKSEKLSRIPILLSAFVCPGAGQFIQKRYMACCIFVAGFMIGFIWLMIIAIQIIISFYKLALEFDTYKTDAPNLTALIPPFVIAILFYLVNLFDVMATQQRMVRNETTRKVDEQLDQQLDQQL